MELARLLSEDRPLINVYVIQTVGRDCWQVVWKEIPPSRVRHHFIGGRQIV